MGNISLYMSTIYEWTQKNLIYCVLSETIWIM